MKKCLFIFILSLILYTSLIAAGRKVVIDSVRIDNDHLSIDFRAEGIIDDKIAEGLRKGRTSTLEYKVQLWGKKSGLLNHIITEDIYPMKVYFDFWENKFVILSPQEKRLTNSIQTVREKCSEIYNFKSANVDKLDSEMKYTVVVEVILRPLSVENYQEIKSWLNGEMRNIELKKIAPSKKNTEGMGNRFLKMFMALTGFGDRVLSSKSNEFQIRDNQIFW